MSKRNASSTSFSNFELLFLNKKPNNEVLKMNINIYDTLGQFGDYANFIFV